jgi:hypothetical protein
LRLPKPNLSREIFFNFTAYKIIESVLLLFGSIVNRSVLMHKVSGYIFIHRLLIAYFVESDMRKGSNNSQPLSGAMGERNGYNI